MDSSTVSVGAAPPAPGSRAVSPTEQGATGPATCPARKTEYQPLSTGSPSPPRGRLRGRHHQGEADLPAEQSQAGQAPRFPSPDVDPRRARGLEGPPAQGPAPSVRLNRAAFPPQMTMSPW